ncbi:MAG: amidohydrolase family protein, partial [Planctomycetaceae bacterium]
YPMSVETQSVVDTHQHLWDLERFRLPWMNADAGNPLRRNFLMRDYLDATRGLNVAQSVYMEVNVEPSQQAGEAEYVLDLCARDDNPMAAAVIGGSPQETAFRDYAARFAEGRFVKGVRTVLHDPDRPQGMCLRPTFIENMKRLGELGWSFDLCMRPGELLDGVRLAERCPGTRFILDHCGNMPVNSRDESLRRAWQEGIRAAAGLENMVCKISGIVVTANEQWTPADLAPNVNFCLDAFGEDRVLFAGDWPVCTLRATFSDWLAALQEITRDRSAEFRKKLFHENAARFYGLE